MIHLQRMTGLRGPDRHETRTRQLSGRPRFENVIVPPIVIQPAAPRTRDQPVLPDCVGCAAGGGFHALTGYDPSDRGIWREAQRRESGKFDPNDGALLEYAVDGLMARGVSPYVPGEEFDESATLETWVEGEQAHDQRQLGAEHRRLDLDDLEDLRLALAAGMVVFDGGGVTQKFMSRGPGQADIPAGLDELGGNANGHSQRVRGYWLGATLAGVKVGDLNLYQGSWSDNFAGCSVPVLDADGKVDHMEWAPGCFWAKAETWARRWDGHAIRVALP